MPITGECVVVVLLEVDLEDGALHRALVAARLSGADDAASIQRFLRLLYALQATYGVEHWITGSGHIYEVPPMETMTPQLTGWECIFTWGLCCLPQCLLSNHRGPFLMISLRNRRPFLMFPWRKSCRPFLTAVLKNSPFLK